MAQIVHTAIVRNLGAFSDDLKWHMVIPTGQTNTIGTYFIPMFIMIDGLRRLQRRRKKNVFFVIEALLVVLLPLMGSRSTLLITLLYIMIRYIMPRANFTRGTIVRTILSIVGCTLILAVAMIVSSPTMESFQTLFSLYSMTFSRFQVYKESVALFLEYPIFGRGPYSYHAYDAVFSHNFILETLVQQGIVGSIPFIAAIFIVVRRLKRLGRFHATYFYAVVFLLIKGLMEPTFFLLNFEIFFWFFVGAGCRGTEKQVVKGNDLRTREYVKT